MFNFESLTVYYVLISILLSMYTYKIGKAKGISGFSLLGIITGIFIPILLELIREITPEGIPSLPSTSIALALSGIIVLWNILGQRSLFILTFSRERALECIEEGILIVDDRGKVVDRNIAFDVHLRDIIGKDIKILGEAVTDTLRPWPQWYSYCRDMMAGELKVASLSSVGKRYYSVRVEPIKKGRHRKGTISIIADITDNSTSRDKLLMEAEFSRKQLKEMTMELSLQKKQLEGIIDNISDHCLVIDGNGKYIIINKAARTLLTAARITSEEDIFRNGVYFDNGGHSISPDSVPTTRVMKGESIKNYRLVLKNHEEEIHLNLNGTPVYNDDGEFLFGVISSYDITELVMKERMITTKNKKLKTIISTVSDMAILLVTDRDGKFIYKSKSVGDYFPLKQSNEAIIFRDKEGVYFTKDREEIAVDEMPTTKVLKGEKVSNFHYIYKQDREERHFLFNGTPIFDENDRLIYGVFFNIDITEQVIHRRLLSEKEQLEVLNRLKDKLFTVITHDIRDPLTAVISLTELLEEEKEQYSNDIIEIIDAVKEYIIDTYELIEHLFDWVKSQRSGLIHSPSQLRLAVIINGVLKLYKINADTKGISIRNNIREDISVFADKEMLEIVLRNLLSNAIKFTEKGGSVTLSSRVTDHEIIISVSDTGIGIHQEKVKQLFSEAHSSSTTGTTGEKGTGIGLLICREFVRLNGGEIWVETYAGEGSTFYFSVPTLSGGRD